MRDPKRIPVILKELGKLWEKHPDLRFYQLAQSLTLLSKIRVGNPFYVEDDRVLEWIKRGIER